MERGTRCAAGEANMAGASAAKDMPVIRSARRAARSAVRRNDPAAAPIVRYTGACWRVRARAVSRSGKERCDDWFFGRDLPKGTMKEIFVALDSRNAGDYAYSMTAVRNSSAPTTRNIGMVFRAIQSQRTGCSYRTRRPDASSFLVQQIVNKRRSIFFAHLAPR